MSGDDNSVEHRRSIWPVLLAPLVVFFYYFAFKGAFAQSIVSVLGKTATMDIDISDFAAPKWGSHWFYRSLAEVAATGFAAFVAAGLAHGRERLAAIVAGCSISLVFLARIAIIIYARLYMDPSLIELEEPWYQYLIEAVMIFAAPFIAISIVEVAASVHDETPAGFGGINRLHFLWLWVPAYWYALGLITPISRVYGNDGGVISAVMIAIVNLVPLFAVAIPGYYGLALLSGHSGAKHHFVVRNLAGVFVLIFGFVVGAIVQIGWYKMFAALHSALFG